MEGKYWEEVDTIMIRVRDTLPAKIVKKLIYFLTSASRKQRAYGSQGGRHLEGKYRGKEGRNITEVCLKVVQGH